MRRALQIFISTETRRDRDESDDEFITQAVFYNLFSELGRSLAAHSRVYLSFAKHTNSNSDRIKILQETKSAATEKKTNHNKP